MISLFRAIKFAFEDIFRNFSLSCMTVLILVLMLLSVNTLIMIRALTFEATQTIKSQVDVTVFFSPNITEDRMKEVERYLRSFPEVTDITITSKDDALKDFKDYYKDNAVILSSLEELQENPLGARVVVKTRQPKDYQKIMTALSVPEYADVIEAKTFSDTEVAINRIDTITERVETFSIGLTTLFGVIAFLIIFNTIRVAIFTQRIEISIKKLVGATNWFIRSPYIIEACIFTVFSIAITVGLVYSALGFLDTFVAGIFSRPTVLTSYFESNILFLVTGQFVAVLLLTVVSSLLAMGKYLRV